MRCPETATGTTLYRIEDGLEYENGYLSPPRVIKWLVERRTHACAFLVAVQLYWDHRRISGKRMVVDAHNRYAWHTEAEAWSAYYIRKQSAIAHAKRKLKKQQAMLAEADAHIQKLKQTTGSHATTP